MQTITRASGVALQLPDDVVVSGVSGVSAAGDMTGEPPPAQRGRGGRAGLPTGPVLMPGPAAAGSPAGGADPVVASLQEQGMSLVDAFEVAGAPGDPQRRRAPAGEGGGALSVQVAEAEDAVLLLERDGVYSWRYPAEEKTVVRGATRRGAVVVPASKVLVFDVEIEPIGPGMPDAARSRGLRGPVGDFLQGRVRAWVLKFVARVAVGQIMKFMERNTRRGLVLMGSSDPERWEPVEDLSAVTLPSDRPARVLLFVHGTFSSTLGSFGALGASDWGRSFLDAARRKYDLILGYDHSTLSDDPLENATDLLARLERGRPAHPPVFDAVSYSRGGLVLRSLIEDLLPTAPLGARVRRAVFVGATNGGTELAETKNWKRLVDLYTNLAVAGCKAVGFLAPGSQVPALILQESLQALGALVKYLAVAALDERGIPGLAAMSPRGEFVTRLNGAQPGQPGVADSFYCVITSDFDVALVQRDEGAARELPRHLVQWILDGLVDGLMREANDLVVNTAAMSQIDPATGAFVKDRFDFGRNPHVYHTVYFTRPELVAALARWLEVDGTPRVAVPQVVRRRGGGPPARLLSSTELGWLAAGPPPPDEPPGTRGETTRGGDFLRGGDDAALGVDTDFFESITRSPAMSGEESPAAPPPPAPDPDPGPAPTLRDRFYFAASMPDSVEVRKTADVLVAISRDVLDIVESAVSRTAGAEVLRTRKLIVQIIAKKNLEVVGDDRVELEPGELGRRTDLVFEVQGTDAGAGEVWVIFRQGPAALATLRLEPRVTGAPGADGADGTAARGRLDAAADSAPEPPVDVPFPVLQIFERQHGDQLTYQFVLDKKDGSYRSSDSRPLQGNRADYVAQLYKEIENRWVSSGKDAKAFEREMRAYGGQLLDELVPLDVQQDLWELRDQLGAIHVLSEEPFIPWEIVHLKAPSLPGGIPPPLPPEPHFLAQKGLVRWLHNRGKAPREIRIREGHAFYAIPDYPHSDWRLPAAQQEIPFLRQRLHAKPLEAESNAILDLLERPGAVDLFHFSGHGEADSANAALAARIMLLGRVEGNAYIPLYLKSTDVQQSAQLAGPEGNRPLVILNACQVGRVGWQLTSIGGFAEAFLRAGAGAFVGALWSVGDKPARTFTESFYTSLLAGRPIAEATCAGREAARSAGEATWLAYVVYGHPLASVIREEG